MGKIEKLNILYEDKYLIIVNKPSGLLTISTDRETTNTLYRKVSDYVKKQHKSNKIFVVHRLDKDTSGLILFAKDLKTKTILQDNWNKTIRKYYGIVEGNVDKSGIIKNYLAENKMYNTFITSDKNIGKYCETSYRPIIHLKKYSLLDINITTGRKNQIRVSLASIKHPIIGDKKYGNNSKKYSRLYLHAYYLSFEHPISKEIIVLEATIPKTFTNMMNNSII